jgi:hypothetical protein
MANRKGNAMPNYIHRPDAPTVGDLRLREDGYIVHDIAALRLQHATRPTYATSLAVQSARSALTWRPR